MNSLHFIYFSYAQFFFLLYIRLEFDAKNTFFFLPPLCFKDKNVEIKLMRCEVTYIILGFSIQ